MKREEEAAATALRVQEAEYARLEAIRRAMLAEAWKLGEPERIAARAAEEHKRIASEAKANRLMHVNAFLIYLNFLWAAPLWGAICGVIFGIAGAVIGQFSAGSTASYGAGLGLSIGSIIGVIFVILRLVVNVRKHLSGSSNLLWIDILTICMIISIGVSLFVFVQKPEEMISQYFLDSPKKKDQSQTKKGIAVNSMKKSLQPTTGLATLSPGQVESPPVGVDPQTTPSTTYTMRMRDLTEKKYKGVLGGQDQDYKISGSFDATRPPTEALRFTAQREGGALPINFKSKSLTKETPYLQDYSGSWECDRYSGVCDIQIQNNGDYMLIYLYENEPTGNKSVATMIVNRTMK